MLEKHASLHLVATICADDDAAMKDVVSVVLHNNCLRGKKPKIIPLFFIAFILQVKQGVNTF